MLKKEQKYIKTASSNYRVSKRQKHAEKVAVTIEKIGEKSGMSHNMTMTQTKNTGKLTEFPTKFKMVTETCH